MAISVFFSYSHKDEEQLVQLKNHLSILVREGVIETWYDRDIGAGSEFEKEIDQRLSTADVILLLVSANFTASDYAYEKKMPAALARHDRDEAIVIPVLLQAV